MKDYSGQHASVPIAWASVCGANMHAPAPVCALASSPGAQGRGGACAAGVNTGVTTTKSFALVGSF